MKSNTVDISTVSVVILAAGKGTRMKGEPDKNKVTYLLHGKPIILHATEMLHKAGIGVNNRSCGTCMGIGKKCFR